MSSKYPVLPPEKISMHYEIAKGTLKKHLRASRYRIKSILEKVRI